MYAILKQLRFYMLTIVFTLIGLGIRLLPIEHQNLICNMYKNNVLPVIDTFLNKPSAAGVNLADDGLGTLDNMQLKSAMKDYLDDLLCPGVQSGQSHPRLTVDRAITILAAAVSLAFVLCFFIPPRPSRRQAVARLPDELFLAAIQNQGDWRQKQLVLEHRRLAIRAAQFRSAVVYALTSCAAVILVMLNDKSGADGFSDWHPRGLILLSSAAVIGGAWATQRPALRYGSYGLLSLAFQIGFGGVFLGGLIAMAIALPYILSPALVSSGKRLPANLAQEMLTIRLLLLPAIGFLAAAACAAIVRGIHKRPLQWLAGVSH